MLKRKLLKIIKIFVIVCILAGMLYYNIINSADGQKEYGRGARTILTEYAKKENFKIFGIGGQLGYDIKGVAVTYLTQREVSQAEARQLLVKVMEDLVKIYNENKELRPFFRNYPFQAKDIYLDISFVNEKWLNQRGGKITEVISAHAIVYYSIDDATKNGIDTIEIYEEPYEEAKRLVLLEAINEKI